MLSHTVSAGIRTPGSSTARPLHGQEKTRTGRALTWCRKQESNLRPTHYECAALPTELLRRGRQFYVNTRAMVNPHTAAGRLQRHDMDAAIWAPVRQHWPVWPATGARHTHVRKKAHVMGKGRLEAFSDGVLAIIITIMVLQMGNPAGPHPGGIQPAGSRPCWPMWRTSFMWASTGATIATCCMPANGSPAACSGPTCTCCSGCRCCPLPTSANRWMHEDHTEALPTAT